MRYLIGFFIGLFISSIYFHYDNTKHERYIVNISYWTGCVDRKVEENNKKCDEMADEYAYDVYE